MNETESKAIDIQGKFELYLVSLTFTLLALSVQTAEPSDLLVAVIAELLGWILLTVSGLWGLLRFSYVPVVLKYGAAKEQDVPVNEQEYARAIARASSNVPMYLFFAGVVAVAFARAQPLVTSLVSAACDAI